MLLSKNIGLLSLYSTIYLQQIFVPSSIVITPITINNDPYLNYVVLNINGDTALSGNNNTFLDSGFRNISSTTISAVQGTFSPFSPAGWSGYFDGSSYLTVPDDNALELSTGNFTIDVWINTNVLGTVKTIISKDENQNINWGNLSLSIASNNLINFVCNPNFGDNTGQVKLISTTAIVVNNWMHVAVSRSGNNWYLFINGVIEHTINSSVGFRDSPSLFYIGCSLISNNAASFFNGYISNLRIIKGTALNTSTFTPNSAEPLKLLPNTSLLTLQNNRFIDNSRNNFTLSVGAGTPQIRPFSPIAPAVDYTPSLHGGSAYFDGNGYLSIPTNPNLALGSGDFTVEFWINRVGNNITQSILDWRTAQSEVRPVIYITSFNILTFFVSNSDRITTALSRNAWNHIAIVRNSSVTRMFVNGISASTAYTDTNDYISSTNRLIIGCAYDNTSSLLNGYISNLRIVKGQAVYTSNFTPPSRPVTATSNGGASVGTTAVPNLSVTPSLLLDFDNGGIIDRSYKNIPIVAGDAGTRPLSSKFGFGSLFFDGTGDYLEIPVTSHYTFTGDFTIEAWTYRSTAQTLLPILEARATQSFTNFYFIIDGSGKLEFQTGASAKSTSVVPIDAWVHICVVRSSGTISYYINGVKDASTYSVTTTIMPLGKSILIANLRETSAFGRGYIEDLRITNGVARYTGASFTPPSKLQANNSDPYYSNVVLFLDGNNIGSNVNNEFRATAGDAARLAITRTGNTTQGSFSPFSPNGWSGFFKATTDKLAIAAGTAFQYGTNNFTIEAWINMSSYNAASCLLFSQTVALENYLCLGIGSTGLPYFVYGGGGGTNLGTSTITCQLNQWYHIALVRSGTGVGQTNLYVNGIIAINGTCNFNFNNITYNPTIGAYTHDNTLNYNGYISNLRIVKGQALYTSPFTPPTGPLPALSGSGFSTSLLTLQDNRFKDNSPNNLTVSVGSGTPSVQAFNPYKQSTAYTPTVHGGSGYFNGSSYLTVPADVAFSFGTNAYTIEAWVFLTARNSTWGSQIIGGHNYGSNPNFLLYVNTAGNLIFQAVATSITSTQTIPLNTWTHVAFTNSGLSTNTTYSLYINGVRENTTVATPPTVSSTINIAIGSSTNDDAGARLTGYISNLRIVKGRALYTSTFTPPTSPVTAVNGTSLLLNFDNGYAIDSTGNNVITTVGNSRTDVLNTAPLSSSTGSLYFDGASYLQSPSLIGSSTDISLGDFTIELWVKYPTAPTGYTGIISRNFPGSDNRGLIIITETAPKAGIIHCYISSNGTGWDVAAINTGIIPTANKWHHIALTRDSSGFKMWIDGVNKGSPAPLVSTTALYNVSQEWNIGSYSNAGPSNRVYMTGYIDDLRITKGVARYTNNFTPQTYENPTSNILTYPSDPYKNYVVLDINADTVNNEQNNTFLDKSGNNLTITRTGSTTQGSFSPFSPAGWSGFFNGINSYLSIAGNNVFNFGSSDWTVDAWVYLNAMPTSDAWPTNYDNHMEIAGVGTVNLRDGVSFIIGQTKLLVQSNDTQYASTSHGLTINTWNHLAYIRSGNNILFYVNGITKGSAAFTGSVGTGGTTYIGCETGQGAFLNGYISNLRVVKGQALYTNTFTPPTAALTTTSTISGVTLSAENVALLTLQDNRFKDNSNNNFTLTVNGAPSIKPFSPFQPTANYSPAIHGGSGYFNGGTSYLLAGISSTLDVNSNYTIETWFYKTGTSTNGSSLFLFTNSTTNGTHIYMNTSNQILINDGVTPNTTFTTPIISNNVWYHLAAVRSGTVTTVYLNGVSIGTSNYTPNTTDRVSIGGYATDNTYKFVGYLSNIRIVKGVAITPPVGGPTAPVQAVSGTSLLLNFDNAGVVDSSGKNNVTTFDNAKVDYANLKYGTGALKFDGTNDYMQVGTASDWTFLHIPNAKWTIEFWVYKNSTGVQKILLDTAGGSTSRTGLLIGISNTENIYVWITYGTASQYIINATSTSTIPLTTWTHVAITYDHSLASNNMTMYFNGLLSNSFNKTNNTPLNVAPFNTLNIGSFLNGAGDFFNGSIDELRITNAVRYTGNFTVSSYTQPKDPNQVSITYLIVGGGGGGGVAEDHNSGGGAGGGAGGGILYNTFSLDTGTVLPVIIGAGGGSANSGSISVLGDIYAYGGGYGGSDPAFVSGSSGGNGGNGGGGAGDVNTSAGVSFYATGYSGGNGGALSLRSGGGGGGASQKGFDNNSSGGGNGGDGANYYGSNYAGGGGGGRGSSLTNGGSGGLGGGGNGGSASSIPTNGSANTGGGGGGGRAFGSTGGGVSATQSGASGGSGVVILSIPTKLFSNKVSGNPTITVSGENTIITYNNSGSYTV